MERMKRSMNVLLLVVCFSSQRFVVEADSNGSNLTPDVLNLQQIQRNFHADDLRRLSPAEQAQILSDVQQHRPRFRIQAGDDTRVTTDFPSLAKYKVDRVKQQQEQRLLEQQRKLTQQLSRNGFDPAANQYRPTTLNANDLFRNHQRFRYQQPITLPVNEQFPNILHPDPATALFDDSPNGQLRSYLEKQRQLELLQRQRDELLAQQQELRRQQELLRLEQLKQLTTTTTTTTTQRPTTFPSLLVDSPTARSITPAESDLFLKAIATHRKKYSLDPKTASVTPRLEVTTESGRALASNILSLVEAQESKNNAKLTSVSGTGPQVRIVYQGDKAQDGIETAATSNAKVKSSRTAAEREALIKQLKLALAQTQGDDEAKNITSRDIVLPNGKTFQILRAPNGIPSAIDDAKTATLPTTTTKPPKAILDELTGGVLPPGANFEVLRHKLDGNLEEVDKIPIPNVPGKKVTFVVLEEQSDGSYKIQGVKGNGNDNEMPDVASIVQRIKTGELKLPPSSRSSSPSPSTTKRPEPTTTFIPTTPLATTPATYVVTTRQPTTVNPSTWVPTTNFPSTTSYVSLDSSASPTNVPRQPQPVVTISSAGESSNDRYVTSSATPSNDVSETVSVTSRPTYSSKTTTLANKYFNTARPQFVPTMAPVNQIVTRSQTESPITTTYPSYSTTSQKFPPRYVTRAPSSPTPRSIAPSARNNLYEDNSERFASTSAPVVATTRRTRPDDLVDILRAQGLYAMAKFLKQSRLDSVLNETGPYTIFVPTDKAFRTLLIQLGGPEKAEEKFQENPRLLSGLLLHHVVPGAFAVEDLQDEMTGVSLAGTQLRVNSYAMQDIEWNDVRVTTINGARVSTEKRNVKIPQGIAHAIDRVMFPLPVGDLVQTLQADRDQRFATFLRALHASGLEDAFSDTKTFTIFAPTNSAFASPTNPDDQVWINDESNREAARSLVARHVVPSTLYTVGMRYYQQKDTLSPETPVHIYKNGGRIKVNNGHVVTHNIPATNGVLHAVDSLL